MINKIKYQAYDYEEDEYINKEIDLDSFENLMYYIEAQANEFIKEVVQIYTEVLGEKPNYLHGKYGFINDSYKFESVLATSFVVCWNQTWQDGDTWREEFPLSYLAGDDWRTLERQRAERHVAAQQAIREKEAQRKEKLQYNQYLEYKKKFEGNDVIPT